MSKPVYIAVLEGYLNQRNFEGAHADGWAQRICKARLAA
jgi:hypothetical protein